MIEVGRPLIGLASHDLSVPTMPSVCSASVFDYGAPVGLRLALAHPEHITAIISQNGIACEEAMSDRSNPIQKYRKAPTPQNREALRDFLTPEATEWQYADGVRDESPVAPESYTVCSALLAPPGNDKIQLDTCCSITPAKLHSIPSSRSTSAANGLRYSASGARAIRFFCPPAPKPLSVTPRIRTSTSTTPATSRWKLIIVKLLAPFVILSGVSWCRRRPMHDCRGNPRHRPKAQLLRRARDSRGLGVRRRTSAKGIAIGRFWRGK